MSRRIGVDGSILRRAGAERGLGRYASHVIDANRFLQNELIWISVESSPGRLRDFLRIAQRSLANRRARTDIYHALTPYFPTLASPVPTVTSILDLAPLDLPGYSMTGIKGELMFRLARRSESILTLSRFSAGRIIDKLEVDPQKVVVAPLPVTRAFQEAVDEWSLAPLKTPFIVSLAPLTEWDTRKRTSWLAQLAGALAPHGVTTYLVGGGTEHAPRKFHCPHLIGLGQLSDSHWRYLVSRATVYLSTTAYEGQGLPLLEAMSCGTPIVGYANSSITEVVGSAGVLLPEPFENEAWKMMERPLEQSQLELLKETVVELVYDPDSRQRLADSARSTASQSTQTTFAAQLERAYSMALN